MTDDDVLAWLLDLSQYAADYPHVADYYVMGGGWTTPEVVARNRPRSRPYKVARALHRLADAGRVERDEHGRFRVSVTPSS